MIKSVIQNQLEISLYDSKLFIQYINIKFREYIKSSSTRKSFETFKVWKRILNFNLFVNVVHSAILNFAFWRYDLVFNLDRADSGVNRWKFGYHADACANGVFL